jgi:hypothetical protein
MSYLDLAPVVLAEHNRMLCPTLEHDRHRPRVLRAIALGELRTSNVKRSREGIGDRGGLRYDRDARHGIRRHPASRVDDMPVPLAFVLKELFLVTAG